MIKKSAWVILLLICISGASLVEAANSGPILARNILGGAGAGALMGFSAGVWAYGMENNVHPEVMLTGAAYGFLGGALLGTGVGMYQISNNQDRTDFSLSGYIAGGTGIGALVGGVVATIPYLRDGRGEDFTVGIGLGGVVGALLGLGVAMFDLSSRPAETQLLSGTITIYPETGSLASLIPEQSREPVMTCRLVKVTF